MAHDYLVYRTEQLLHTLQLLRLTVERRFAKDDAVDAKLTEAESEAKALIQVAQLDD